MSSFVPFILNINKPQGITSFDVIRKWKPRLRAFGKIGHFGTLDPFASGVLMLGVGGAQRLNEFIHECLPKTYLAKGKLGIETETGDLTVEASQKDESDHLTDVIAKFDTAFVEQTLKGKFLGKYMQAPHKYSAAKHEGKALHRWARAGVEITKEKKEREVYSMEIVKYEFPDLWIRYTVSSGTYIRTLFSDCARELGTLGVLDELIREQVGGCNLGNAISSDSWQAEVVPQLKMDDVLDFSSLIMAPKEASLYSNGVKLKIDRALDKKSGTLDYNYFWIRNTENQVLGLAEIIDGEIISKVNFSV